MDASARARAASSLWASISARYAFSSTTRRCSKSFLQSIITSYDEDLGLLQDCTDESCFCRLRGELLRGENGWVYFARQALPRGSDRDGKISETYVAYDHDVDVAFCHVLSSRYRAVEKGHGDSALQTLQCFAQHIDQAHGFGQQALEFREKRADGICRIVDLTPLCFPDDDAGALEIGQFPLEARLGDFQMTSQVAQEPRPSRTQEER